MKSATLPSFLVEYRHLNSPIRAAARKAYRLWAENPFHPSLHFKCIDSDEGIGLVRLTRSYRALGVLEENILSMLNPCGILYKKPLRKVN